MLSKKEASAALRHYASLAELHGANTFKIRGYQNAAIALNSWTGDWEAASQEDLAAIDGLGKSVLAFLADLRQGSTPPDLAELEEKTPAGVQDLMKLPGMGVKKVLQLWKDADITSVGALKEAAEDGTLAKLKGFGQKTVDSLLEHLAFAEEQAGKLLLSEAWTAGHQLLEQLRKALPQHQVEIAGDLRRQLEVVDSLSYLISYEQGKLKQLHEAVSGLESLELQGLEVFTATSRTVEGYPVELHFSEESTFAGAWLRTSCDPAILQLGNGSTSLLQASRQPAKSEEEYFSRLGLAAAPAPMRESIWSTAIAENSDLPSTLDYDDLKGILHNHSTYSDGAHTLRQMAENCRDRGHQYLGITDHSQAAFYANGLDGGAVKKQQEEIAALNDELAPFHIFSGIESDILSDGELDYSDKILASFDFIVSSVHSPLQMDRAKATERLLKAIHNPHTTILGHPTGRLLLRREGYPIDHKAVIDACASQQVCIEINANARRLDLDWRWAKYALDKGVMLAINPDAHSMEQYDQMRWGWLIAQKIGLPAEQCLNAMSFEDLRSYFQQRKTDKGIVK